MLPAPRIRGGGDNNPPGDPIAGDSKTLTVSGVSAALRYVPAGSFQRDATEANVTVISKGYWLAETETTQELFTVVMGANPSNFDDSPDGTEVQGKRPVERVSWYDAIAFCNKLSLLDGKEPVYS
ncbi:MAG: SUMF1/EgtB/PvdO family nonheme iron enzyme, partial [Treponema sp.]|nr:SUMF1/EgtB/PvdO family nonheme iron enzyme [Treponema sp.]